MDVKKLTIEASMHAAQNDRLPLRVVVQVLFFEQVRAGAVAQAPNIIPRDGSQAMTNMEDNWEKPASVRGPESCKSLRRQMNQMKIKEEEFPKNGKLSKRGSKNSRSGVQLLPSRSRRMFDKLWAVGKRHGGGENRSSETSGSSQSPTSVAPGETKSSGSSSRQRRHSIS